MQSNTFLTVVNCTTSTLTVNSSTFSLGTLWVAFNVVNYFSVRGDNLLSCTITGASPSFYSVGAGSTHIALAINNQGFTVTNSNTTFAAPTSFTVS